MKLNTLKPAPGSKSNRHRVGRGVGSGWGKTAGRGHKGQRARSGGFHKVGFEGGQMPLQRRLPKRGFVSPLRELTAEVRLSDLSKLPIAEIDILALKAAGLVPAAAKTAKVIKTGTLEKAVKLSGLAVSKGARSVIETTGGTIAGEPIRPEKTPQEKAWQKNLAAAAAKPETSAKTEKTVKTEKTAKGERRPKGDQAPAQEPTKD